MTSAMGNAESQKDFYGFECKRNNDTSDSNVYHEFKHHKWKYDDDYEDNNGDDDDNRDLVSLW